MARRGRRPQYLKDAAPDVFSRIDRVKTSEMFPELNIDMIGMGNITKIYWTCEKHPEFPFLCAPSDVRRGIGCGVCNGRQVIPGYNSLEALHPELIPEFSEDNTLDPDQIAPQTNKKVWWKCLNPSHPKWMAFPDNRVRGESGCPYCSGRVAIPGENDLASTHPELAEQWHPSKNMGKPSNYTPYSHHKAWWKCTQGHEWQTTIANRAKGSGCKSCSLNGMSKLEFRLIQALNEVPELQVVSHGLKSIFRWKKSNFRMEVDIVVMNTINHKLLFIELDGAYWHQDKMERDVEKTRALLTAYPSTGVVRIRCGELEHLPIEHERLLQLDYDFSFKDEGLHDVAEQIRNFLDSGALAEPVVWSAE